ncbi:hypothetical protein MGQ_01841 [Candida albicans P76067]|nr:hypothetical protein MGQ_01841 [Candida albicans P76067]
MWKIFKMYVMTSSNYYPKPRVSMVHLQGMRAQIQNLSLNSFWI